MSAKILPFRALARRTSSDSTPRTVFLSASRDVDFLEAAAEEFLRECGDGRFDEARRAIEMMRAWTPVSDAPSVVARLEASRDRCVELARATLVARLRSVFSDLGAPAPPKPV